MDLHILTMAIDLKTANVVFHIPIPSAGTNDAGISWRDAVVMEQGGADNISSVLTDIGTELDSLKSGALVEKQENFRFSSVELTNAQRLAQIQARYTDLETSFINEKQITLAWMGYSGDVS